MINQLAIRSRRLLPLRAFFSQVTETRNQSKRVAIREDLQFSKKRLTDFGELPYGEIPTALQYSRPSTFHKLSNGVTVATETYPGHQASYCLFNSESLSLWRLEADTNLLKTAQLINSSPDWQPEYIHRYSGIKNQIKNWCRTSFQ